MGLVQVAAVDAGRLGRDELDGRDVEFLAEGVGGQVRPGLGEGLVGREDAGPLALQVHPGGVEEPEGVQIIIISPGAHAESNVHEGGVAGMAHRLL